MRYSILRPVAVVTIIVAALAGAWVSGSLLEQHDGGWSRDSEGTGYLSSLCGSQVFPSAICGDVVSSRWGSFDVYVGSRRVLVPTSLIGLCYFLSIAIWFFMVGPMLASRRRLRRLTFVIVAGGLAGSLFFIFLMGFTLREWCPLCVAAHAANGLIFCGTVLLWWIMRREPAVETFAAGSTSLRTVCLERRLAISAVAVMSASCVALWFYFDATVEVRRQWRKLESARGVIGGLQSDPAFLLREYYAGDMLDIPYRPQDDASSTAAGDGLSPRLLVFTDYDCAACACFDSGRSRQIEAAFPSGIEVEYRPIPRDPSAGRDAPGRHSLDNEPSELRSTFAAEAARLQGGREAFDAVHRLLFDSRRDRPHRDFAAIARRAGLDVGRFLADMDGDAVRNSVARNVALARRLGVRSVPAVFLDGRSVPDLCVTSAVFWHAFADTLARGDTRRDRSDVLVRH